MPNWMPVQMMTAEPLVGQNSPRLCRFSRRFIGGITIKKVKWPGGWSNDNRQP